MGTQAEVKKKTKQKDKNARTTIKMRHTVVKIKKGMIHDISSTISTDVCHFQTKTCYMFGHMTAKQHGHCYELSRNKEL